MLPPSMCLISPHPCASLPPRALTTAVPVVQQEGRQSLCSIKASGSDCGRVPVLQQEEEAAKRQAERVKRPAKRVAVPKHGTVRMQEPTEV